MHITICDIMLPPSLPPFFPFSSRPTDASQASLSSVRTMFMLDQGQLASRHLAIDARPPEGGGGEGQMDTKVSHSIMGPPPRVFPHPQERRKKKCVCFFPSCVTWGGGGSACDTFSFFEENLVGSHDPVFHPAGINPNNAKPAKVASLFWPPEARKIATNFRFLYSDPFAKSIWRFRVPGQVPSSNSSRETKRQRELQWNGSLQKSKPEGGESYEGFFFGKEKESCPTLSPSPLLLSRWGRKKSLLLWGGWDETIFRHDWVCPPLTAKGKLSIQFSYSSDVRTTDLVWWTTAKCTKKFPEIKKNPFLIWSFVIATQPQAPSKQKPINSPPSLPSPLLDPTERLFHQGLGNEPVISKSGGETRPICVSERKNRGIISHIDALQTIKNLFEYLPYIE